MPLIRGMIARELEFPNAPKGNGPCRFFGPFLSEGDFLGCFYERRIVWQRIRGAL